MSDSTDIESLVEDFEPTGDQTVKNDTNEFLLQIQQSSGLKVLHKARCARLLQSKGYSGLVSLFVGDKFIDQIWKFTNVRLRQKGYNKTTRKLFRAYVGLEMAMSIVQFNDIKSYWKTGVFLGHDDFKSTMSRARFQQIRGALCTYHPVTDYRKNKKSKDPLWHSRALLEHFQKNCVGVAVPLGVAALDEAGFRTKARTLAKSYMPSKPDKYAVRFYAVVGNTGPYLSALQDNRKGNSTGESGPDSYVRVHREMNGVQKKISRENSPIDSSSATATWVLMMSHLTKTNPDPSGRRIFFTDNFYTRHALASELKTVTDGEARLIGTVKFSNVDGTNREHLKDTINEMKDAERGTWKLLQVYDKHVDLDKLRKEHSNEMKKLPKKERTRFIPPPGNVAENAGFVVWKDSKVVVFY